MPELLDLTKANYTRIFVTGRVLGDLQRFMRFLYEQQFMYKDALILCGDTIDIANPDDSISIMEFAKANDNVFAVKGDQEDKYLKYSEDELLRSNINYQLLDKVEHTYKPYISEMPCIIKALDDTYVAHAGVNPLEGVNTKDEDTFFKIGDYDVNSRFYQFNNPEKKNWYDFKIFEGEKQVKMIFSATSTPTIAVPAGYSLHRSDKSNENLKCMILEKESSPIIIEVR